MDKLKITKSKIDNIKDKANLRIWKEQNDEATKELCLKPSSDRDIDRPDIDKKISELECLIKKLQDEIVIMSNDKEPIENVGEYDSEDMFFDETDDLTSQTDTNDEPQAEMEMYLKNESKLNIATDSNNKEKSIIDLPTAFKDIGLNLIDKSNAFAEEVSNLVNYKCDTVNIFEDIRRNFSTLWSDDDEPSASEQNNDCHK